MPPDEQIQRTADGTIADQSQSQQTSSSTEQTLSSQTTEAKATDTTTQPKADTSTDSKSLTSKAADTAKTEPKAGAPEKYEAWKLPDGLELDPKTVEASNALFKELGLSQEAGQKLVDQHVKMIQQAQQDPVNFFNQQKAEWRKEMIADKALGNGTDNLSPTTLKNISNAISALPADLREPFKEAMDYTGVGDHPAFVRAFNALGALLGEGDHVRGSGPSPLGQTSTGTTQRPTAAQSMYPNLPSAASGR